MAGLEEMFVPLIQLLHHTTYQLLALGIPLPVGLIGGWRWSVWLFRRLIGLFYRPLPPNGFHTTTTVVIPVYNEVPHVFGTALRSWALNRPTEIIAVIDHTDQQSIRIFEEFTKVCEAIGGIIPRMIITTKPGKRPALVDGMSAATGEIICLVDSDTIWAEDVLTHVLAPFADPDVGGVTTRQNVLSPSSVAQRIFDVYLDIRYEDEVRFLTAFEDTPFGDAVTCLSGRTAVYRRAAVLPVLDGLLNETFLGKRVISGDDKALTLLVQGQGWKVRYQENARVYTPGAVEMRVFLKQRLRWARNSWRADLKAISSGWAWRKPLLALHLLDRLLQPLTTIVAPLYVSFAIFHQHWLAVLVVVSWWFVSRGIKLWPHLRRNWWNIGILPAYVAFNYWSAVMRIYAFFTMNEQGWITRWNKSRMAIFAPMRAVPAYLATVLTIGLVASFIFFKSLSTPTVAQSFKSAPMVQHNILPTTQANAAVDLLWSNYVLQPTLSLNPDIEDLAKLKLEEYAQRATAKTQVSP
jgi:hyaluronan synthase